MSKETFMCPVCEIEVYLKPIYRQVIKDFPEDKSRYIEMECPNTIKHDSILRRRELMKLTQEKRQEMYAYFKTGKTIGETAKHFNVDSMIIAELVSMNIETAQYLRSESL